MEAIRFWPPRVILLLGFYGFATLTLTFTLTWRIGLGLGLQNRKNPSVELREAVEI